MALTTISRKERFLLTVRREETDRPPVWIMRQAGRYLPSYMALRERFSFRDFCLKPEVAAEATLQPIEQLDSDIAIIFNDILIPLEQMGIGVEFPNGGPQIAAPIRTEADLARFNACAFTDPPVAHSLREFKRRAGPDVPVLGFCGGPFTLAVYAVEGKMSKDQHAIKELMYRSPALLHEILDRITETAGNYLVAQIESGRADGVQVFESWGGILPMPHDYEDFAAAYQRRLIGRIKSACPGVPVILYIRGGAGKIASAEQSGADVLGLDWMTSLADARSQTALALQGNLDPMVLVDEGAVEREFARMLEGFDWRRGWIANLGHGITPQASPAAAKRFVDCVKQLAERR
jgi:uroporphyrinogen decarboxylase